MTDKKEIIPIFFATDDGYAPYLGTALASLTANASEKYQYKIHILYQQLNAQNKEKLSLLKKSHADILFVPMERSLNEITDKMANRLRADYLTLTIYFRLFIPVMFPEYDKGIYLDSDIVVPGDISELYRTDLGNALLGAVPDHSVLDIPELVKYMEYAIGVDKHHYINSGILLMNLKEMRKAEFDSHFFRLFHKYHFDCIAPDQDYINAMCADRIFYLPKEWDAMPVEGRQPLEHPKLIHFNLFAKPWNYKGVPYETYFWQYAKDSGYYETLLKQRDSYSAASREHDRETLKLLIFRSGSIAETKNTFKCAYENGEKIRL